MGSVRNGPTGGRRGAEWGVRATFPVSPDGAAAMATGGVVGPVFHCADPGRETEKLTSRPATGATRISGSHPSTCCPKIWPGDSGSGWGCPQHARSYKMCLYKQPVNVLNAPQTCRSPCVRVGLECTVTGPFMSLPSAAWERIPWKLCFSCSIRACRRMREEAPNIVVQPVRGNRASCTGVLKQCLGTRNEARARRDGCTRLADVL